MTPRLPWTVLQDLVRADPAAPRVTFYERTPGPTSGERIELSGKVLLNWVSKAANLLAEEFDVEVGTPVTIDLPAAHWRTVYWTLAAWSLGAQVRFADADSPTPVPEGDVLVTARPQEGVADQIVVTLAALARAGDAPDGALDEASELSSFADVFTPITEPDADDTALRHATGTATFEALTTPGAQGRVYLPAPDPAAVLGVLAAGGGVVLIRGPITDAELDAILAQESAARP